MTVKLLSKFTKRNCKLFNERLERERTKQIKYYEKQRENGKKGGRPRKNPLVNSGLTQTRTQTKASYSSDFSHKERERARDSFPQNGTPKKGLITPSAEQMQVWRLDRFEKILNCWPKRAGIEQAKTAWIHLLESGVLTESIQQQIWAHAQTAKKRPDWSEDGGRYCPKLETWLKEQRWTEVVYQPMPAL